MYAPFMTANGDGDTDLRGLAWKLDYLQSLVNVVRARGVCLIADLAVNHTSDQHSWLRLDHRSPKGWTYRSNFSMPQGPL